MQLLVTGLSGFVGSYCAEQLDGVDLRLDGRLADLRLREEVTASVDQVRPGAVIHLAAQSWVPASFEDPVSTYDVNFFGTLNLLRALKDTGFTGRMLYVGSADSYGAVPEVELPVVETRSPKPLNPYAVSKAAAEALCYQWSQTEPFEIVMARPFNHIGPRQSTRFAVASFARQIAACRAGRGSRKLVVGDAETTRDFTDVRDIVRAYASLLQRGRNGEAYNVCSGVERKVRDVIDAMMRAANVDMAIEVEAGLLRKSEQRRMLGSFAKLNADCGWSPEIPFERTLLDTLDYWNQEDAP
ncbi:MAG: GDP-mannose 4,6-dehydratase [Pseudomonadota bacterium]